MNSLVRFLVDETTMHLSGRSPAANVAFQIGEAVLPDAGWSDMFVLMTLDAQSVCDWLIFAKQNTSKKVVFFEGAPRFKARRAADQVRFEYADEILAVFLSGVLNEKVFVESVLDATESVLRWIRSQNNPGYRGWELDCLDFSSRARTWLTGPS